MRIVDTHVLEHVVKCGLEIHIGDQFLLLLGAYLFNGHKQEFRSIFFLVGVYLDFTTQLHEKTEHYRVVVLSITLMDWFVGIIL